VTAPSRSLYVTLAVSVLIAAALVALLAWPGAGVRPMRTQTIDLDEPTPGHATADASH
jgi:hypothetical protein